MDYTNNDTIIFLSRQSIGLVPNDAKSQIYDVANYYYNNSEIGLSELLRFGTDMYILGRTSKKGN